MRGLFYIVLISIALAVLRWLIKDVIRAVKGSLGNASGFRAHSPGSQQNAARDQGTVSGHLVRDPISGIYIDEKLAIKETINGETLFFESRENRDTYLKKTRSG